MASLNLTLLPSYLGAMLTAQGSHGASGCSQDRSGNYFHELGLVRRMVNVALLGRLRIRDRAGMPRPAWIPVVVILSLLGPGQSRCSGDIVALTPGSGVGVALRAGPTPQSQEVGLDQPAGAGGLGAVLGLCRPTHWSRAGSNEVGSPQASTDFTSRWPLPSW